MKRKEQKLIMITMILLLVFQIAKSIYVYYFKFPEDSVANRMQCMVVKKEKQTDTKISYLVSYGSAYFLLNIYPKEEMKFASTEKMKEYQYGDIISFRGKITYPKKLGNPYEFDYGMYLHASGMVATITTNQVAKIGERIGNIGMRIGERLRFLVSERVDTILPTKEANLFKSMIYGQDNMLEEETINNFRETGMSHMLAVSGTHVMFLCILIKGALKNVSPIFQTLVTISMLLLFCTMSGLQSSVIRSCIMGGIGILFPKQKYAIQWYHKMGISLYCLLVLNPFCVFQLGLWMSFLATIGILLLYPTLLSFFQVRYQIPKPLYWCVNACCMTFSSLILVFPLQIFAFSRFEWMTFLSNMLLAPLFEATFLLCFIALLLSFIPIIGNITLLATYPLLHLILYLLEWGAKINYGTVLIPRPTYHELVLYYLLILTWYHKKYIPAWFSKKMRKRVRNCIGIGTICIILYMLSMDTYRRYGESYLYYFNVGQGNMAILHDKRKTVLIDMGSTKTQTAYYVLSSFLKAKGIANVDLVCITHMHEDHMNGITSLARQGMIKEVAYTPPKTTEKGEYESLDLVLKEHQIPQKQVQKGDYLEIGDIQMEVLSPPLTEVIMAEDMLNANSTIYLVRFQKQYFLWMGDATIETEEWLIPNLTENQKEKIASLQGIQVGHHGSQTSSSEALLQLLPFTCHGIISAQKKIYGHPSEIVVNRFLKAQIRLRITEKEGAIKFFKHTWK